MNLKKLFKSRVNVKIVSISCDNKASFNRIQLGIFSGNNEPNCENCAILTPKQAEIIVKKLKAQISALKGQGDCPGKVDAFSSNCIRCVEIDKTIKKLSGRKINPYYTDFLSRF